MRDCSWVVNIFENITTSDFDCSSDSSPDYNCIAWAAGSTNENWWPHRVAPYIWPDGLPTEQIGQETLDNFIMAFQKEGYKKCWSGRFSRRYEKVAIYVSDKGRPLHAARTLETQIWSSKLGTGEDIEHKTVKCLEGKEYGRVKVFLKRRFQYAKKQTTGG